MNVFLIESPLQLLNALEAKYYYKLPKEKCDLLVLNGESPNTIKQIMGMVEQQDWNIVKKIGFGKGKLSWITRMLGVKAQYKCYKSPDKVFIGDYRSDIMRDFVNTVVPNKTVLLDDGTVSLRINNMLSSEKERHAFFHNENMGGLKRIIKRLAFLGKLPPQKHIEDLEFFTTYNIEHTLDYPVIKNNYTYLKTVSSDKQTKDEVWFLGSPLSEKGILEEKKYIEYLSKIVEYYKDFDRIVYIPHRAEDPALLQSYGERGFDIIQTNVSIEFYLMKQEEVPSVIASFYSSALGNLHNIFGETMKIDSFRIEQQYLPTKNSSEIADIYNYYSKIIHVVDLKKYKMMLTPSISEKQESR